MTYYDLEYNFRRSPFDQACKRILDENKLLNDYGPWKQKAGDVIDAEYTVVADVPKIEDGSAEPQEPSA